MSTKYVILVSEKNSKSSNFGFVCIRCFKIMYKFFSIILCSAQRHCTTTVYHRVWFRCEIWEIPVNFLFFPIFYSKIFSFIVFFSLFFILWNLNITRSMLNSLLSPNLIITIIWFLIYRNDNTIFIKL